MERTEEDKILRVGVSVTLGGKEYEVRPLVIKDAREWRKKFASLVARLPSYAKTTTDNPTDFEGAVNAMLVSMPDEIADLFFSYAKDLDREAIEAEATEVELAKALEGVMTQAFPLLQSLAGALGKLAR